MASAGKLKLDFEKAIPLAELPDGSGSDEKTVDSGTIGPVQFLDPEDDRGPIEYKYTLQLGDPRIYESRASQLHFRIQEGNGLATFYIGVCDNGYQLGLTKKCLEYSLLSLDEIMSLIDAEVITHRLYVNLNPVESSFKQLFLSYNVPEEDLQHSPELEAVGKLRSLPTAEGTPTSVKDQDQVEGNRELVPSEDQVSDPDSKEMSVMTFQTAAVAREKWTIRPIPDHPCLVEPRYVLKLEIGRKTQVKNETRIAVLGNVDSGKTFMENTPIMMADRSIKLVQDIQIGDQVLDNNGHPTNVVETHSGHGQLYRIIQKSGIDYVTNGPHILSLMCTHIGSIGWDQAKKRYVVRYAQNLKIKYHLVKAATDEHREFAYNAAKQFLEAKKLEPGYHHGGDIVNISVEEYLQLPTEVKCFLYGYKPQCLDFSSQEVPLDPYFLGVWLGDGTSLEPEITGADQEIIDYLEGYASKLQMRTTKTVCSESNDGTTYKIRLCEESFTTNRIMNTFRNLSLLGNKHIPDQYLFNSKESRLKLLAGLLDTDGHLAKNMYEITQKSKRLANDITFLVRSLGLRATQKEVSKACVKPDGSRAVGTYYRINISGEQICEIPVLVSRKKAAPCGKKYNFLLSAIKVEPVEPGNYHGFQIDNQSGLFLAPDLTVWHNSTLIGVLTGNQLDNGRGSARALVFNHPHELSTGRTSSIGQRLLGLSNEGKIVNDARVSATELVHKSDHLVSLIDLAGHLKYLNTTVRGICGHYPDGALIIVGANRGVQEMTREHIAIAYLQKVPMTIVVTKIDITPDKVREATLANIKALLRSVNYNTVHIKSKVELEFYQKQRRLELVPIFTISNVQGINIDLLTEHIHSTPKQNDFTKQILEPLHASINETFQVSGVGTVISVVMLAGQGQSRQTHWLGPFKNGTFKQIYVKSIQYKRTNVQRCFADQAVTFAIRGADRREIKKGMVVVDGKLPHPSVTRRFQADITIVGRHSTSIREFYEPVVNIDNTRQAVKILKITNIKSGTTGQTVTSRTTEQDGVVLETTCLRSGDTATVEMEFKYSPVYLRKGALIMFREQKVKGYGTITDIL